jgi:hypothetical protein
MEALSRVRGKTHKGMHAQHHKSSLVILVAGRRRLCGAHRADASALTPYVRLGWPAADLGPPLTISQLLGTVNNYQIGRLSSSLFEDVLYPAFQSTRMLYNSGSLLLTQSHSSTHDVRWPWPIYQHSVHSADTGSIPQPNIGIEFYRSSCRPLFSVTYFCTVLQPVCKVLNLCDPVAQLGHGHAL